MIDGLDVPPICQVKGCQQPAQVYSKKTMNTGGKNTYLKTCRFHNYLNLEGVKERIETFWPPENS